jgi:hypothetical protein
LKHTISHNKDNTFKVFLTKYILIKINLNNINIHFIDEDYPSCSTNKTLLRHYTYTEFTLFGNNIKLICRAENFFNLFYKKNNKILKFQSKLRGASSDGATYTTMGVNGTTEFYKFIL